MCRFPPMVSGIYMVAVSYLSLAGQCKPDILGTIQGGGDVLLFSDHAHGTGVGTAM